MLKIATPVIERLAPELRAAAEGHGFLMVDFETFLLAYTEMSLLMLRKYDSPPLVDGAVLNVFPHHFLINGVHLVGG